MNYNVDEILKLLDEAQVQLRLNNTTNALELLRIANALCQAMEAGLKKPRKSVSNLTPRVNDGNPS
jgi:hypothetical protein